MSVRNYHGYSAYDFGDPDATARPYVLGGLGATQYGTLDVNVLRLEGRCTPGRHRRDRPPGRQDRPLSGRARLS